MEVASLALSAVQTVLTALDDRELNVTLSSIIGYKSQIEGLKKTVKTIDCVLRSAAETKVELSLEEQNLIEELKDVIFEADDLLDEFVTLAQKKKLLQIDGTVSEKVKLFFSPSNNAYRMAKGVKKIRKKLDAIASDSRFSFKIDPEPIRKRSRETCSYVNQVDIIGREDDLEKIIGMLLDSTVEGDVSFLAIVGMGGLGKTALAQLVYNDPRVTSSFPLRLWICVSDQDQIQLDIEGILRKMLDEATAGKKECSSFEQVQRKLREKLQGNKYLIVLDDVWTENCVQWRDLVQYLICGEQGSRIVVTTRSQKTATIVGGGEMMYELHGLSEEDSWCLFEKTVFGSDLSTTPNDLVEIGGEIVNGCAGVPLAIRVAGSLLYGQDKSKWHSVQRIGLPNIRESKNDIMPILKLSFHHLESPLKSCFSYCAMFPKDFVIDKKKLIILWMAQSYIVPLNVGQSIEDAGEEYFSILVKRCFFQDIKKDKYGEIYSCKIHDLMHDIAQDVSGKEIYATNVNRGDIDKKVRHLSFTTRREYYKYSLGKGTHIRSHLCVEHPRSDVFSVGQIVVKQILENCRRLRALDLSDIKLTSLPHCIGELLHLRYLDLSSNAFEVLPKSITNLCNLQTLNLIYCFRLQELPKGLGRLVNLRDLNIYHCDELNCMGIGELSWLHRLSNINLGEITGSSSWKNLYDDLEDLKPLNSLKGHLDIIINWPTSENDIYDVEEDNRMEELYMLSKEHLTSIKIEESYASCKDYDQRRSRLMKGLQPHPNLKHLNISGFSGVRTISWVSHLPNLVSLDIGSCKGLKYLPSLQNLLYLKSLRIRELDNLEYLLESGANNSSSAMHLSSADQVSIILFPSLEKLELSDLPKFKGWRRVVEGVDDSSEPEMQLNYFSQLKSLYIYRCPGITICPSLEKLHLNGFNSGLQKEEKVAESSSISYIPRLREVTIDNVAWLKSTLPMESFPYLKSLTIFRDKELVNLPDWMQYLANLQTLKISGCKRLEAMPNWMPELTSLNKLEFEGCSYLLMRRCEEDPPGEDWPHIQRIPHIHVYSWFEPY